MTIRKRVIGIVSGGISRVRVLVGNPDQCRLFSKY
jgi:hypothetical protein